MLQAFATPAATTGYASQFPALVYQRLGRSGLLVSQAGFGSYRIHNEVIEHRQALRQALLMGINLIDTSTNYSDGASETLIGELLAEMVETDQLKRQSIVVVSKAGYLQGKNLELSRKRKEQGRRFPDLIQHSPGLEHCIHPEFLEDQIGRSQERLKLECVDVYLLHNPEYFLQGARRSELPLEEARKIYYERIEKAFRHLEKEVAAGRIGCYGVSSNTFPESASNYTFTSLSRLLEIAESISPDHHFRVIQLPLNLFEGGAATEPNQPNRETVLQFAYKHDIAVLTNRPLNAIQGNRLLRLAGVPLPENPIDPDDIPERITEMVRVEKELGQELLPLLQLKKEQTEQLKQMLIVGQMLEGQWQGFGSYQQWMEIVSQQLAPRVNYGLHLLKDHLQGSVVEGGLIPGFEASMLDYSELTNQTFAAVGAYYQAQSAQQAAIIRAHVRIADPDWEAKGTLSQIAIRAIRSTQGVTSVLVGMRHEAYVEDVLKELARPVPVKPRDSAWQRLSVG